MAIQKYATSTPRIGKMAGAILKHAIPVEVLGITGKMHNMDQNDSDTVVFRRWLPTGATASTTAGGVNNLLPINTWTVTTAAHLTSEGVTPIAETIAPQDITVVLNQYSCLYQYSDKTAYLYEDNVPREMKVLTGERMGLVRELIRYGALKGCTNKYYAGDTSRAAVDETISLGILRKVTRSLQANRGRMVTEIIDGSKNYNTAPVERGYLVFAHSDMENDIRELPGFKEVSEYGSRKTLVHEMELGSADRYRFICSPELAPYLAGGAAVGSTGLVAADSTNIDVYPIIVVAADAWGDVALRGLNSFDVTSIPPGTKSNSDPLGQRGVIGAIFWSAAFIQNDGWMAVVEAGATAL